MQGRYRQPPREGLLEWLLGLWDDGAEAVYFTGEELGRMGALPQHPRLRNTLRTPQQQNRKIPPSLMEWVRDVLRLIWPTAADINNGLTGWTTISGNRRVNVKKKKRVSCGTVLRDLLRAGMPWREVDGKPSAELLERWLQLQPEQSARRVQGGPMTPTAPLAACTEGDLPAAQ
uniref:Uncharacterized protein n=1 Tax=Apteryx owenii TaxID=8824 RepID=A0A8B9Q9T7_APTOW